MSDLYKSPSRVRLVAYLENGLLSADRSWWTGRRPRYARVVANVPRAVYLNFLVRKSFAAELAAPFFRPLDLPEDGDSTLFTILVFVLERARPVWAPQVFSAFAPRILQSNWRFYGDITQHGSETRSGVLFIRTVTNSLALSVFGRRVARCFPLRRAQRMKVERVGRSVTAAIEAGGGSAPELVFEGEAMESARAKDIGCGAFATYEDYARWIIDQHLSLTIWPNECVVQDMHLDFQGARITPLRCQTCRVSGLENLLPADARPINCFLAEGLQVFLDDIYAFRRS